MAIYCSSVPLFKMLSLVESSSRISMAGELVNELETICTKGAIEESGEKIERLN